MMLPKLSNLLVACGLAVAMSACSAQHLPPPRQPALRVGVTPDTAPYVFLRDNRYAGIEVDFAARLATALGRRIDIVPVAWDEQISSLLAGRTDMIMSGMSITPDRAARVAFGEPYLTTSLEAAIRREDAKRWPTPEALLRSSPRIGVKTGTTGEALVLQRRPDEDIVRYRQTRDAITELRNYRIDVYVSDAPIIKSAVSRNSPELVAYPRDVGQQSLAWAFRPGDEDLRRAANAVLRQWRADGTLRQVIDAWPSIAE